ncbi:MAG: nitronate monooxygenase [Gammaproteobacteria bacterium]
MLARLGITTPIIQAPLAGGGDTPELAAAVSNAGALGFLGCNYLSTDAIAVRCRQVRELSSKPFGANLFAPTIGEPASDIKATLDALRPFYAELGLGLPEIQTSPLQFDAQLDTILDSDASVFSFTCGLVDKKVIDRVHRAGKLVLGTATTVAEGRALCELGVDGVIAQGAEAGGHRATFLESPADGRVGLFALVPQLEDAIDVPIVASGAIMNGRGIAAALALGASAVQMGTAFLWCPESGINTSYRNALAKARDDSSVVTQSFSGKPARGIANRFIREMTDKPHAGFPIQNELTRPLREAAKRRDLADFQSLWAGQAAGTGRALPAAKLVNTLMSEFDTTRKRWG